jgi:very-short-patch-repair endonuclease
VRDSPIARLQGTAAAQRGLFTLAQALDAGYHRPGVRRRLERGVWTEVAPRVYRAAPAARRTWIDELAALVLSCDGVAARRSAAALFELLPSPKAHHLLVARGKRNLERAVVHSSIDYPASDLVVVTGIRATSPARTVIDAATDLRSDAVDRFVDDAVVRGLCRPAALERRARELVAPARPGAARVLRALASSHPQLERARNTWEARMLRTSRLAGLPDPVPNFPVTVGGRLRLLDLAWDRVRVCAEFDGYLSHLRSRQVFDDDRVRQNDLVDAGWLVFRVTSTMLQRSPRAAFAPIVRAVEQRSVSHEWHTGVSPV